MTAGETHLAASTNDIYWRYVEPAPKGVKLTLLTIGNVQVTGEWVDNAGYKAWSPLLRRDKKLEIELGL